MVDHLSRVFEPGKEKEPLPAALPNAHEVKVPLTTSDHYRVPVARVPRRRGK